MDRRLPILSLGLALAFAAAACGGSATPAASSGAEATAAAPTEAAESQEPAESQEAVESGEPASSDDSGGPDVSFTAGAAADLEALLPDKAGSITFTKGSFDGSSLGSVGLPMDAGELQPILDKYGKTINDVRVAMATPADAASGAATTVFAMQIKGVPADELLKVLDSSGSMSDLKQTTIGGKQVLKGGAAQFTVAVYTKDDTLFYVLFADDKTLEEILSNFP